MAENPLARIKAKLIAKYGKDKGMDVYRSASKDISNQIAGGVAAEVIPRLGAMLNASNTAKVNPARKPMGFAPAAKDKQLQNTVKKTVKKVISKTTPKTKPKPRPKTIPKTKPKKRPTQ